MDDQEPSSPGLTGHQVTESDEKSPVDPEGGKKKKSWLDRDIHAPPDFGRPDPKGGKKKKSWLDRDIHAPPDFGRHRGK